MHYYIGLDNGGTATKAAVFDCRGHEIGNCGVSTAAITPRPGFVERNMEEMWQANCRVVRGALEKTGVSPEDIAGVGISGHGKGLYLWGKNGQPVRNGIISTDNRAWRYPVKWAEDGTEKEAFRLSLQHVMSCQPVSLLRWLKDNEPENYAEIKWVFECKDYVRFRLTGEAKAEITDYSGANLLNLKTRKYDRRLLELFGIGEMADALPPLCQATEIAGYVTGEAAEQTGLKAGTPVIGGMFDINACAIGAGVLSPDLICMIAGTWSINEYIRREPVLDGKVKMNSLFALPEYYLIEESSPTSAGNFEWYVREMLPEASKEAKSKGKNIYDIADAWVEELGPETFVPVFLPFLMASNVRPNAMGAMVGLAANHTRKHLARSIFEGITFSHRYHFEKLMATRENPPRAIRLAGGAARAAVWTQMFADVMDMPVETVKASETGALGCAIAAAAATGEYTDIKEATDHMTEVSAPVMPIRENAEIYRKKYGLYLRTIDSLDGLWDDMQKLVEESR